MSITPVPISIRLVRADRRQQRKRRGELAGEVVHAHEGTVEPQLLGGDRELDRLDERVARGLRLRPGGRLPVPEGEEPDPFHGSDGIAAATAAASAPPSAARCARAAGPTTSTGRPGRRRRPRRGARRAPRAMVDDRPRRPHGALPALAGG